MLIEERVEQMMEASKLYFECRVLCLHAAFEPEALVVLGLPAMLEPAAIAIFLTVSYQFDEMTVNVRFEVAVLEAR